MSKSTCVPHRRMSGKFPCTLGESDFRTVVVACRNGDYSPPIELVFRDGQYMILGDSYMQRNLENAFDDMIMKLLRMYQQYISIPVTITMTSPTDEEREAIMRVWNEWNDQNKEETYE